MEERLSLIGPIICGVQLAEIESEILNGQELIEKVKTLRDQYFAHNDISKKEVNLTAGEIMDLFVLVEKIMQKVCDAVMRSTWRFVPLRENCKEDTSAVVDHLQRFKPYLMKEFVNRRNKTV